MVATFATHETEWKSIWSFLYFSGKSISYG